MPEAAKQRSSVSSPLADFWFLGGASIFLCILMHLLNPFRDVSSFQVHFVQIGAIFSILAIFCNDPHFLISYRFGYGRGAKFIFKYWFSLIVVPLALIAAYAIAFFYYDKEVPGLSLLQPINHALEFSGLSFRIGLAPNLGDEIIGQSIWLMYFTVGWHYCKQVYGCMMVYAHYHSYHLEKWHKQLFKWSAIFVAIYQFTYIAELTDKTGAQAGGDSHLAGIHITPLGLPEWARAASGTIMWLLMLACIFVLVQHYRRTKQRPPINFLVPWIALYAWWVPFGELPEYYYIMVPFFHSLQYLPFAFRMEEAKIKPNRWHSTNVSFRILLLLFTGFLAFELVPTFLDTSFNTAINQTAWFFVTSFVVFINIHHFFIDHVVWRFQDPEIKKALL